MSRAYDEKLDKMLAEADAQGMCLAPRDRHLQRLLRTRVNAGSVKEPARGLFADAASWEAADMTKRARAWRIIRALQHLHPTWVFCSFSAALAHGLELPNHLLEPVHVISTYSRRSNGIVHHTADAFEIRTVMELRATDMIRTLFDCLKSCTFPQGLAIADSALRNTSISREGYLHAIEERFRNHRGVRTALRTMSHADGLSENGGESYARGVMIELGFKPPDLQVRLADPLDPSTEYRLDYGWDAGDHLILGELDGKGKYADKDGAPFDLDTVMAEREREARLTTYRPVIFRFAFSLVHKPDEFAKLLETHGVPRVNPRQSTGCRPTCSADRSFEPPPAP